MHRPSHCLSTALLVLATFAALPAHAAPKDKSANKMIDKAINEHYLGTNFRKAESLLLGTIKACGEECSEPVLARAWMYVGVVRGSGNKDQKGAKAAFEEALEQDPEIALDENIADAATKKSFAAVAKKKGVTPAKAAPKPDDEPEQTTAQAAEEDAEESAEEDAATSEESSPPADQSEKDEAAPAEDESEPREDAAPASGSPKNWVGLHFALDFAKIGGTDVCAPDGAEGSDTASYACFDAGTSNYFYAPVESGAAGSVGSGFARGTSRLLLSFDRFVTNNITIGGRVGYAFGGGPTPAAGTKFMALHLEPRVSYWFGADPRSQTIRPYIHGMGGVAQVDTKVANVPVRLADGTVVGVDAWHKTGTGFLGAGGGLLYAFTPTIGAQLNLNAMLMLGDSGFVIEPSLGIVYGFGK